MRFVIAGGTGLLGQALTSRLTAAGHQVVILSRSPGRTADGVRYATWTPDGTTGPWANALEGADVVVNLAGAGIADRRWTPARKALLRSSRLESTASLVAAVGAATTRPRVFVQGSAVGYYGAGLDDRPVDEASPPGTDFLATTAVAWEAVAQPVADRGCRLVVVRTGIVLSPDGGALPPMARAFRWLVGGPIGTGRQYLSWIAIDDWISMVEWAVATPSVSGPINATAPVPVTNAAFARTIARTLGRPNLVPAPSFALRLLFGELAEVTLLAGQRVLPTQAIARGFQFGYPELDAALAHLLGPA